jgi:hypothetical protein
LATNSDGSGDDEEENKGELERGQIQQVNPDSNSLVNSDFDQSQPSELNSFASPSKDTTN